MRKVGQADPRQLQVLQIDKGYGVAVKERHILSINGKHIVSWFLNVQRLQIGTRINQPGENEVIRRNELQSVNMLPVNNRIHKIKIT